MSTIRKSLLKAGAGIGLMLLMGGVNMVFGQSNENTKANIEPGKLTISVVQFHARNNLVENVRRHCDYIRSCAKDGARVVVFPECSVTNYDDEVIESLTQEKLNEIDAAIAAAAKEANVYAIVGMPTKNGAKFFNSAVVFTPDGKVLERYHKVQLVGERWAVPGDHMSVFPIDDTLASIIICHDERYPELVRLPVIAGARIVFYISYESGITEERKIVPYRAQIVARAVENSVYIAHANAPGVNSNLGGSHGQSRIIRPDGNIISEASIFDEEVITATLDMKKANGNLANQSLGCDFLKSWWEDGASKVRRISKPE